MKIARIRIQNVLGIEHLEIEPGSLTVVSGGNGKGKTSVVEAIKSVLGGGHDASLLRNGAESGEVVLVLDDETEIRKRITEKGSTLSVKDPIRGTVGRPQGFLAALTDALSVNPVQFLTASPKDRARYLLEAMPLTVTLDDLHEAMGPDAIPGGLHPGYAEGHALDVIERVRKEAYDARTGINRAAKEKRATVDQLAASLPAEGAAVDEERIAQLEQEDAALAQRMVDEGAKVSARAKEQRGATRKAAEERIAELRREIERVQESLSSEILLIDQAERKALDAMREEIAPRQEEIRTEKRVLQERAKEAARHDNTARIIRDLAAEAAEAEARSQALTAALDGLEALKARLLEQLPLKGVEVRDGEIYRDGVPFDRLNRAQQVQIALQVARMRAGDLPLICVDGLECLDADTFGVFCERAAQTDLQLIVTRVTEGAFTVESLVPAHA